MLIGGGGARGRFAIVSNGGGIDPVEGLLLCSFCFEDDCNVGPGLLGARSREISGGWEAELDCDKLDAESFLECPSENREEIRFDLAGLAILPTQT